MLILDGKKINSEIASSLREAISRLDPKPKLLIIQVGSNLASDIYIKKKTEFADKIGASIEVARLSEEIKQEEIVSLIEKANQENLTHGIIIQLPIPNHLNQTEILNTIYPDKDVDGIGLGKEIIIPATTRGVLTLLEKNNLEVSGKNVVIINDSDLVGKPTAKALSNLGANITICNDQTQNLKEITQNSDILITAIGQPEIIDDSYLSEDQVVIDIGISKTKEGVVGDLKKALKTRLKAYTPVPGGVGPMTVASLFQNLLDVYEMQQK